MKTEIDLRADSAVIRAQARTVSFNLDRQLKGFALLGRGELPAGTAEALRRALAALAERGQRGGADLAYARRLLAQFRALARTGKLPRPEPAPTPTRGDAATLAALIRGRRSVRFWLRRPPSVGTIRQVIEAGLWAPSACNRQPLRFVVARGKAAVAGVQRIVPHPQIERAPAIIFLALDGRVTLGPPEEARLDAGAAAQNMLLTAHALGLGACWMGQKRFQSPELHAFLRLPAETRVNSAIVLGFPADRPDAPGRVAPKDVTTWLAAEKAAR